MIFGRAGEELAELERHGIPATFVPGITAALGMASALGMSLTHRDHAQSVRFVTAHSRYGALPCDIDWRAIADPGTTTIFYMGGRTTPEIVTRLIEHGMAASTPAAIAQSVSGPGERVWAGALSVLSARVAEFGHAQPILVGVGNALAGELLPARLRWSQASTSFESRAL